MEQIYDSRHSGQDVDDAVDAVRTTIPSQLTQIGSELDKKLESDEGGIGDLDIADGNGNVLARFYNGHIKTKYFDSSQINIGERKLKICVIGNSYSCDSFMYVPFILKNYGIDIELGIYYRGGASLQNQIDEWLTGNSSSFYYIDTTTMTAWTASSNATPYNAVRYKQWDIVVIQQSSTDSVTASTFQAARELEELILDNVGRTIVFGWNININRASSGSDYTAIANTILDNIEATCKREPIDIIFPYGTAIFNARTNATLDAIGAGGDLWASDKVHLQEGLPCYIAALANVQALFNRYYPQFSVMNDTTRPTAANITAWNVQGQNGSSVGVTEANCRLAQICAVLANKFNFEITTIYG